MNNSLISALLLIIILIIAAALAFMIIEAVREGRDPAGKKPRRRANKERLSSGDVTVFLQQIQAALEELHQSEEFTLWHAFPELHGITPRQTYQIFADLFDHFEGRTVALGPHHANVFHALGRMKLCSSCNLTTPPTEAIDDSEKEELLHTAARTKTVIPTKTLLWGNNVAMAIKNVANAVTKDWTNQDRIPEPTNQAILQVIPEMLEKCNMLRWSRKKIERVGMQQRGANYEVYARTIGMPETNILIRIYNTAPNWEELQLSIDQGLPGWKMVPGEINLGSQEDPWSNEPV